MQPIDRVRAMIAQGHTAKGIAKRAGIHEGTLYKWLKNGTLSSGALEKVVAFLDLDLDDDDIDEAEVEATCLIWDLVSRGADIELASEYAGVDVERAASMAKSCPKEWLDSPRNKADLVWSAADYTRGKK